MAVAVRRTDQNTGDPTAAGQTPETAEKILRNLKREHQISDVAGGYYLALDGLCKPDQRTILAVWVLLRFIDYVDPMAHYPAVYPSQIFF